LPSNGKEHTFGNKSAIYLTQPGICTKVKTWVPSIGQQIGFLVTHSEAITISDYFSLFDEEEKVIFRPTVYYAYHPVKF
jgi:homospermidine synthase